MSKEIKRMRYFNGLLLKEEDLTLEQNYNMRLHRLHNRYFHDWGIMDGLAIEAVVGAPQIKVSQGMALNRVLIEETKEEHSQEILICDNHPDNPVDLSAYTPGDNVYISVCYEEVPADIDRQKGGHEIHVWERAIIKHGTKKPDDPRKEIILARVTLEADEAGNKTIREISDTDIDGQTKLRTYAVLRGQALEVDKLSIGPKDKLDLPYISGLNDPQIGEGDGLDVHSPFTRFTGSLISGSVKALGNVDIKGALTVTTNNKQALKVNPTGNVDILSAATVGGKLSVAGGLSVKGDSTTIDTAQVVVTNNMVTINKYTPEEGETEPKNQSSGIEVYRGGTAPNVRLVWDETARVWKAGMDKRDDIPGSGMYAVAYGTDWDRMHGHTNVDDLHKHNQVCSPDGDVVLSAGISGDIDVHNSLVASGSVVSKGGSFEVKRPDELKNAKLLWNEDDGHWQVSVEDVVSNILYGDEWNDLTTGANVDSLHIHSQLFNADGSTMALRINPAGDVNITSDLTVGENLTVAGNLNVLGTTTTVNTVNLEVTDNVIIVNKYEEGAQPITEGGLEVYRGGTLPNARIIWDEGSDHWKIGTGSSMVEIPYGSQWEELTQGAVIESLHKHRHLYTESGSIALGIDVNGNTEAEGNVLVNGGLVVENNAQIKGLLAVDGSLAIGGDLTVNGTTTTVNTKTLEVDDKVIVVNKYTGQNSPLEGQGGLEVYRGGGEEPNARIVWEEAEGKWKAGIGDDIADLAYGQEWDTLISGTSADSLHKHGQLCRVDGNPALSVNTEGKVEMFGDTEVSGAFSVGGSMTVEGDLVVRGTTVTQTDMEITDNVIVLNKYTGGTSPVNESGIEIYRGETNSKARIVWDEALKKWRMGVGSELQEIAGGSSWDKLTNQDNADPLHMHSQIYNESGDVLALSASASGNVDIARGMTVGHSLRVLGNLDVRGGLTTINTPIFEVRSNSIVLNRYEPGTVPFGTNSGLMVFRGQDLPNAVVLWDEDNNRWKIGASADSPGLIVNSNGSIIASGSMQANEANIVQGLQAGSASIQGSLTVKTGMEVPRGPEPKAYVMWDEVTDQWKMGTSAGAGISVTAGGYLGIGTEAPQAELDVNGDAVIGRNLTAESAIINGSLSVNDSLTVKGSLVLGNGLEVQRGVDSNGEALKKARILWDESKNKWLFGTEDNLQEIMLNNHKHNNLYNLDGSITALYVNSIGNIGIGTTTPTVKLDVAGDALINGKLTIKTGLEISRGLEPKAKLYWDENNDKWQAGTEGNLIDISLKGHKHQNLCGSDGNTVVNVDSSGNVGIGKTVANNAKLDVEGTIRATNVNASGTLTCSNLNAITATISDDLNAASAAISGNLNAGSAKITNDLTVDGNLTVNGNTVTVNTATLEVEDNIVRVNKYAAQTTPANVNGGLEVFRGGTAPNAQLIWDETSDKWQAGTMGGLKELSYSDHKHGNLYAAGGNTAMTVDTEGNIGIGTTTPSSKLDVQGDAAISGNVDASGVTVNGNMSATNVTASGHIGAASATVSGDLNASNATISGSINAANANMGNAIVSGSLTVGNGIEVSRGTDPKAQLIWDETSDKWQAGTIGSLKELSCSDHKHSNIWTPDGTATVMSISNGGNVGIGTATPGAKLDVQGGAKVSGNLDAASAAITANLSAASATVSGNLSAANLSISNTLNTANITASGNVNAVGATLSGNINAANATVNGTLNTANAIVSGSFSAASAVISGNLNAASATITNDLTVDGNLTVNGNMVTVNTATLEVEDNIVRVNKYAAQTTPMNINGGLEVFRGGTAPVAQLIWDETSDKWQAGTAGSLKELSYSDHKHGNLYTAGGNTAMTVDIEGNIGIGTIAPGSKLDVQGDAAISGNIDTSGITVNGNMSATNVSVSDTLNTTDVTASGHIGAASATVSGNLSAANLSISNTLNTANITASGNVIAVGATLSGNINAANATVNGTLNTANAIISGSLSTAGVTVSGDLSAANAAISGSFSAASAIVENAVFSGSLTVGSGMEVLRGADPKAQLIWDETTDKWQAGTEGGLKELSYSDHKHDNLYTADGTNAMTVDASGNVGIGKIPDPTFKLDVDGQIQAVTFVQTSSKNYKENIEQLEVKTALDLLDKLNPVSFDFKEDKSKKHNIGFIAEEVPDVFATSDHKAVALMDIIGVLTTVVKTQQKEAKAMKKQMTAVQKQVASLIGA
jgi:hypothetical protein